MYTILNLLWTIFCLALLLGVVSSQFPVITLDQGPLVGLKVFPESSRTAVYTFLGIPYAEPPVGTLRFKYPRPHNGWGNRTFSATSARPICLQMSNSVYDETPDRATAREPEMNEDCLYLNIWVPEVGLRFGSLPVLAIITGEEMSFDWARNRPSGLDFSSEGVVVVTIQYRTNVFGWIGLGNEDLPGNFGIHDQEQALQWIQQNIQQFGGNPKQVTLLGHGTSGFACALIHMISPRSNNLFNQLILMSGAAVNLNVANNQQPSQRVIEKLGCQFEALNQVVVNCLRSKSASDLQRAFESVYANGNYTSIMGPVVDSFRPKGEQYIPVGLLQALASGNYTKRPTIVGICSNEGAFIHDYWIDLAKEGYGPLRAYINHTTIPMVLREIHFPSAVDKSQVLDTLNWRYFGQIGTSTSYLLNAMQRIISEAKYESFFYYLTETLSSSSSSSQSMAMNFTSQKSANVYVYAFQITNSMDMRGKVNLFGGASHSSDLPFLLGPSLFQQIARRRFTPSEEKICQKMRKDFVNFVKTGNPTPGRIYNAWYPYTPERKFIQIIGEAEAEPLRSKILTFPFEKNLVEIEKLLEKKSNAGLSRPNRNEFNPYELGPSALDSQQPRASYVMSQQDNTYFYHLKKVYSFWNILLPNIAGSPNDRYNVTVNDALSQRIRFLEASADAIRYKRAFFSMLTLVCILLALLGVLIYLLRRQHSGFSSHSL
ncbi:pyrethroid hydrolase Ces2e [Episyrphus balteatus]|uniref:pyrethroid hydrolase Ces2e n=1 Tax=Episyrphus balteatus TaxID=286459 RepID=UPI002485D2E3|nr:pyrethroid hydrolase Ces2e [Episyrphus balteatus]